MEKDNLLLSFPRCGNTWVRYVLEYISKRPTSNGTIEDCQEGVVKHDAIPVDLGVDNNAKCIAIKRHRADHPWDNWQPDNCNLILLLRDPQEAILRHHKDGNDLNACVEGYFHCLRFYDQFQGKKCLVYYEDLMNNPKTEILKIINFLEVPQNEHFANLIGSINYHRVVSIKSYGASQTYGDKTKLHHHKRMQPTQAKKVLQICRAHDREMLTKYLNKYV